MNHDERESAPSDYYGGRQVDCSCGCGRPLENDPCEIDGDLYSDWCASELQVARDAHKEDDFIDMPEFAKNIFYQFGI